MICLSGLEKKALHLVPNFVKIWEEYNLSFMKLEKNMYNYLQNDDEDNTKKILLFFVLQENFSLKNIEKFLSQIHKIRDKL